MTKCGKNILQVREGTEQKQRLLEALNPESIQLNNFELKDWMRFAYNFAKHIKYFDAENPEVTSGDWRDFFIAEDEFKAFLNELEAGGNVTPHLALFVAFVKLLDLTKQRFNHLSQRHLDFYFEQVLQIKKQGVVQDKVHVLFELAKNAVSEKIDAGTGLDAGKDADGNKLVYKTAEDIVVNEAKVAQLKSMYSDTENHKIKAASIANSVDGVGGEFLDNDIKWWPFAYYETPPKNEETDLREYPELADAKLGFSIAGKIFELKEGKREVTIEISFDKILPKAFSLSDLQNSFQVFCTGEKGWIGPFQLSNKSGNTKKVLSLSFVIPKHEEAVGNYMPKVHGEAYQNNMPVCKILVNTRNEIACNLFNLLSGKTISELKVNVDVNGIKSLSLRNDQGAINSQKPFYPFGVIPVKKSKFYVGYDELTKKRWTKLNVDIEWKNTPESFKDWYYAYREPVNWKISAVDYIAGIYKVLDMDKDGGKVVSNKVGDIQAFPKNYSLKLNTQTNNLYVKNNKHFQATVEKKENETWSSVSGKKNVCLFSKTPYGAFKLNLPITNSGEIDEIRLSLNQSFYHELYPQIYALALTSQQKNVLIPNEPYTPLIEKIELAYSASSSIKLNKGKYLRRDFDFYHEHPFGHAKECILHKLKQGIVKKELARKFNLLPDYKHGGELYVGLENAKPKQIISLLIQVLEGSEKPDNTPFDDSKKVVWSILCNNQWKELTADHILTNNTDNFLKSGILKFIVPAEATNNNTILASNYIWLCARINKSYNLVSKAIGIHAQVSIATLQPGKNALNESSGLPPNSIAKVLNRKPKVKGVMQPYSSFDGVGAENKTDFYKRVSERLRHKNRATTVWDYEHLVLQQFPEIYKVKCLNHTNSKSANKTMQPSFMAPGHVTILVIPDIMNRNVYDIYKPAVSAATLNRIHQYLNGRNSFSTIVHVENPDYEEVRVKLNVKFRKEFDENYYTKQLNEDITKLLSPWAFDREVGVQFGHAFHKSVLVKYIEELGYVDYVSDVKLYQVTKQTISPIGDEVKVASPSNPMAVLVSAKTHDVKPVDCTC